LERANAALRKDIADHDAKIAGMKTSLKPLRKPTP